MESFIIFVMEEEGKRAGRSYGGTTTVVITANLAVCDAKSDICMLLALRIKG